MFTVEMDDDGGQCSTIVTLDDTGTHPDVEVNIYDDVVFIQQYDPEHELTSIITLTPDQWLEICEGMKLPSGAYHRRQQ